jgi:hypothetical protein
MVVMWTTAELSSTPRLADIAAMNSGWGKEAAQ